MFRGEGGPVDENEVVREEGGSPAGLGVEEALAVAKGVVARAGTSVAREKGCGGAALRRSKSRQVLDKGGAARADEDEPK